MTPIRRLALGISNRVVRWASPGCKEWAEGLAREAAVIERDWAALGWTVGSTRVLLDRRPALLTSLDEVPAETQKLVETIRGIQGWWLIYVILVPWGPLLWKQSDAKSALEHVGCVLFEISVISAMIFQIMERRRLKVEWYDDIYNDPVACAHLYKAELGRRFRGIRIGILFSVFIGYCVGSGFILPDSIALIVPLFLALLLPLLQLRRNARRRIEEIDALLAERQ